MITSINNFTILNPSIVNFKDLIKIKSLEDWEYEYVHIENGYGYWIADCPFYEDGFDLYRNFVSQVPVWKLNNEEQLEDPNPMATIHLPPWAAKDIINLLKLFYCKNISNGHTNFIEEKHEEWGNIYDASIVAPLDCWRLPHIDYQAGLIGNLWFTSHTKEETGTVLYKYCGKFYGNYYDFHVDTEHPLHKEWMELDKTKRTKGWKNLTDDELEKWGFIKIAMIPTYEGKMTLYQANIPHSVYINDSCTFRWSHSFSFSHKPPLKNLDLFNFEGMLV
jgi:hypothetical protein